MLTEVIILSDHEASLGSSRKEVAEDIRSIDGEPAGPE